MQFSPSNCESSDGLRPSHWSLVGVLSSFGFVTLLLFGIDFSNWLDPVRTAKASPGSLVPLEDVVDVSVGRHFTCVLTSTGSVKCWGQNSVGQLGNGTYSPSPSAIDVNGLSSGVQMLSAGFDHACVVLNTSAVNCWGGNERGKAGAAWNSVLNEPIAIPELSSGVISVGAGLSHSCALLNDGSVKCWGSNSKGQLGNGTTNELSNYTPLTIPNLSNVVEMSVGFNHNCVRVADGRVLCWGSNINGQVGNGITGTLVSSPTFVSGLGNNTKAIETGGGHSCVIDNSGGLKCWGSNSRGQLGNGTRNDEYSPTSVLGLNNDIKDLILGSEHTCILMDSNEVKCWGSGSFGQHGKPTIDDNLDPTNLPAVVSDGLRVSADDLRTCVVKTNGNVQCWGLIDGLGDGRIGISKTPVKTVLNSPATSLSIGANHACVLANQRVYCWGHNERQQLASVYPRAIQSPISVTLSATNITTVTAGSVQSCIIAAEGLSCWGNSQAHPSLVNNLQDEIQKVVIGENHKCVLTSTGGVKCWGNNYYGQLGIGDNTTNYTPTAVIGLESSVIDLASGNNHVCAVTSTGAVRCWGYNFFGQLGNNSRSDSSIPVDVVGIDSNAVTVSTDYSHSCAVLANGVVRCWGGNSAGVLGDGTTKDSSVPVTVQNLSNVANLDVSVSYACALQQDNIVKCWGENSSGQLGNGTTQSSLAPVVVQGITNTISSIGVGYNFACALTRNGEVYCWGNNLMGQLGNNGTWTASPVTVLVDTSPPPTNTPTSTPGQSQTSTSTPPPTPPTDTPVPGASNTPTLTRTPTVTRTPFPGVTPPSTNTPVANTSPTPTPTPSESTGKLSVIGQSIGIPGSRFSFGGGGFPANSQLPVYVELQTVEVRSAARFFVGVLTTDGGGAFTFTLATEELLAPGIYRLIVGENVVAFSQFTIDPNAEQLQGLEGSQQLSLRTGQSVYLPLVTR